MTKPMSSEPTREPEDTPEFWPSVRRIFEELCEEPPARRAMMLDELCHDADTKRAVIGLLASNDEATDFLSDPPDIKPALQELPDLPAGERIGRYRVIRLIGKGGMGVVYEAQQDKPARTVALKLLHTGNTSRTVSERFVQESELLAQLEHPSIARVYDAGSHQLPSGSVPYFTMEFVEDAQPITQYVKETELGRHALVELFLRVCDAVHSAHQNGIIHRDLKPDNILVGGDGRPRVIDFGIASASEADDDFGDARGVDTDFLGTIRYMSPEQLSGASREADVRCEVYALGVVLYELLAGYPPYELGDASISEYLARATEQPPPPIDSLSRSDLGPIIRQALARSPDARYQSVHEFAEDLRRCQSGRPIEAKRDNTMYVIRKAIQRHRIPSALIAATAVTITVSAVALWFLYSYASNTAENLRKTTYQQTIALAGHELRSSRTRELKRLLESCPEDLRGWEWRYYMSRADDSALTIDAESYVGGALSRDGTRFAHMTREGVVRIVSLDGEHPAVEVPTEASFAESLAFSCDGQRLIVATRADAPGYLIDIPNAAIIREFPPEERIKTVLTLPGTDRFLAGSSLGAITLRSLRTGDQVREYAGGESWVTSLAVSDCGRFFAAGRDDGSIESRDIETGDVRLRLSEAHSGRVSGLAFSSDASLLYSGGWDAQLRTWGADGEQLDVRRIDADVLRSISRSPQGDLLALATPTAIELRDASDGTLIRRLLGHDRGLGAHFHAGATNGRRLVSWSYDSIKLWNIDTPLGEYILSTRPRRVDALTIAPDGSWVASVARGGEIAIHNLDSRDQIAQWTSHSPRTYRMVTNPAGDHLATAHEDGTARVWTTESGALLHTINTATPCFDVEFLDDEWLIFPLVQGGVGMRSLTTGEIAWATRPFNTTVTAISLSPDRSLLAIGTYDGQLHTLRLRSDAPRLLRSIQAHARPVSALSWSPCGSTVASGGNDAVVQIWNALNGELEHKLVGHGTLIKALDFTPDGSRLASSAWEGEIRLWDTSSGLCVLRLDGHSGPVMDVAFTPDAHRILSTGRDRTLRVWDASPAR